VNEPETGDREHKNYVVCDDGDVVRVGRWLRDAEWCSLAMATDDADALVWMNLGAVKRLRDILDKRIAEAQQRA
jgi:hypothetical protein